MEQPDRARVQHLIGIAERDDRAGLSEELQRWCWPGGTEDRTEPLARALVRRRGPNLLGEVAFECTCADGHCSLCN